MHNFKKLLKSQIKIKNMFNTFGKYFTFASWGESHGKAIGVVVDGVPSNIKLNEEDIQPFLDERKPGRMNFTSKRLEEDRVEILSGVFNGKTTGTPISCIVYNSDHRTEDYVNIMNVYRPSHGDYVYQQKYGIRDYRGGGRSSARETIARVIAGAIAKKVLDNLIPNLSIESKVINIGGKDVKNVKDKDVIDYLENIAYQNDSIGGMGETVIKNLPVGIGEPIYQKLSAKLAEAIFSINGVKSFEIGEGKGVYMKKGSENNDQMVTKNGKINFMSNNDGGITAGISNGQDIIFRYAFKPAPSIGILQKTVNILGENVDLKIIGRHDTCIAFRGVYVVTAMTRCVLLDMYLLSRCRFF